MKPSIKKMIVQELAKSVASDELKQNELVIITPYGVITGKNATDDLKDPISGIFTDVSLKVLNEINKCEISPSDGFILLESAHIKGNGRPIHIGNVFVFYDQIIGISIGNFDS